MILDRCRSALRRHLLRCEEVELHLIRHLLTQPAWKPRLDSYFERIPGREIPHFEKHSTSTDAPEADQDIHILTRLVGCCTLIGGLAIFVYATLFDDSRVTGIALIPIGIGLIAGDIVVAQMTMFRHTFSNSTRAIFLAIFCLLLFTAGLLYHGEHPDLPFLQSSFIIFGSFFALTCAMLFAAASQKDSPS